MHRRTDADYDTPNAQYDKMVPFILRHIGTKEVEGAGTQR
jgi:hypothetical protein